MTHTIIIHKNGIDISDKNGHFLYITKAMKATPKRFNIFETTIEKLQNSICIFACIRAKIEELSNWKIVKNPLIKIAVRARNELRNNWTFLWR